MQSRSSSSADSTENSYDVSVSDDDESSSTIPAGIANNNGNFERDDVEAAADETSVNSVSSSSKHNSNDGILDDQPSNSNYLGKIKIVIDDTNHLFLPIVANLSAEEQATQFLDKYNLPIESKEQLCNQIDEFILKKTKKDDILVENVATDHTNISPSEGSNKSLKNLLKQYSSRYPSFQSQSQESSPLKENDEEISATNNNQEELSNMMITFEKPKVSSLLKSHSLGTLKVVTARGNQLSIPLEKTKSADQLTRIVLESSNLSNDYHNNIRNAIDQALQNVEADSTAVLAPSPSSPSSNRKFFSLSDGDERTEETLRPATPTSFGLRRGRRSDASWGFHSNSSVGTQRSNSCFDRLYKGAVLKQNRVSQQIAENQRIFDEEVTLKKREYVQRKEKYYRDGMIRFKSSHEPNMVSLYEREMEWKKKQDQLIEKKRQQDINDSEAKFRQEATFRPSLEATKDFNKKIGSRILSSGKSTKSIHLALYEDKKVQDIKRLELLEREFSSEKTQFNPHINERSQGLAAKKKASRVSYLYDGENLVDQSPLKEFFERRPHAENSQVDENASTPIISPVRTVSDIYKETGLELPEASPSDSNLSEKHRKSGESIHEILYMDALQRLKTQQVLEKKRSDTPNSTRRISKASQEELYKRLHEQWLTQKDQRMKAQKSDDASVDSKISSQQINSFIQRMDNFKNERKSYVESKRKEYEDTSHAMKTKVYTNSKSDSIIANSRRNSLSEIFDLLLWSVDMALEMKKASEADFLLGDGESIHLGNIEGAGTRGCNKRTQNSPSGVNDDDEHGISIHLLDQSKEKLLDTSLAMSHLLYPQSLADAVEDLLQAVRPAMLSREEFMQCLETLLKAGTYPPLNAFFLSSKVSHEDKHLGSTELEFELHCRPCPELASKNRTEKILSKKQELLNVPLSQRLHNYGRVYQQKVVERRKEKEDKEKDECTFQPIIHTRKKD